MMSTTRLGSLWQSLEPGDEVVSATSHRDFVIVITKFGHIYKVYVQ